MSIFDDLLDERDRRHKETIGPLIREIIREEFRSVLAAQDDRLVDSVEAAHLLGISVAALHQRVSRGTVPAAAIVRSGRKLQFRRALLLGGQP